MSVLYYDLYLVRWFVFFFLHFLTLVHFTIIEWIRMRFEVRATRRRKKNITTDIQKICEVKGEGNLSTINRWVRRAKWMIYAILWMPIVWTYATRLYFCLSHFYCIPNRTGLVLATQNERNMSMHSNLYTSNGFDQFSCDNQTSERKRVKEREREGEKKNWQKFSRSTVRMAVSHSVRAVCTMRYAIIDCFKVRYIRWTEMMTWPITNRKCTTEMMTEDECDKVSKSQ